MVWTPPVREQTLQHWTLKWRSSALPPAPSSSTGRETAASLQNLAPRSPALAVGSRLWPPVAAPGSQQASPGTVTLVWWEGEEGGTAVAAPHPRHQQATASSVWFYTSRTVPGILGTYRILLGVCPQVVMEVLLGECCTSGFLWLGITWRCPGFMDLLHWEVCEQLLVTFCCEMSI